MNGGRPDPFQVTELEERVYRLVLSAARGGRLELRTGTYKNERASFLCVEVAGKRYPVAMVLRPDDTRYLRDADLAPASETGPKGVST